LFCIPVGMTNNAGPKGLGADVTEIEPGYQKNAKSLARGTTHVEKIGRKGRAVEN
jgi:hypothetical protein